LSPKNGVLIPPKSAPAIVDAVIKLFESPEKLIEKQRYNAKIAQKEFNLTTHLARIKACLEQTHEDAFKEN
jgi:glycosyltransferase involved in cell wall biosynthesis